ncbi:MAG: hypothetical protein SCK70_07070, partial [bacterium]|nr:hypothetical protein [bacterium]
MQKHNQIGYFVIFFLVLLMVFSFTINRAVAGDRFEKSQVISMVKQYIESNRESMTFLNGVTIEDPELFADASLNPIRWQIQILNGSRQVGFFYALAEKDDDGAVPVWFEGLGAAKENSDEKTQQQKAQKKREQKYFQKEIPANFPKDQFAPAMGYTSLVFDPPLFRKVIPASDTREIIGQQEPHAPGETVTIKYEGFEGAWPNDWTLYVPSGYNDVFWGANNYKKYVGSWSGFCANDGTDGSGYGGQYLNNMKTWMVYGPFSLADANDAWVDFVYWTKTETNYDFVFFGASTNSTNYYGIKWTGDWTDEPGNDNGWLDQNFDLTDVYTIGDLTGESQVWIAFVFSSDGSTVDDGTYLDEIYLKKTIGGEPDIAINPTQIDIYQTLARESIPPDNADSSSDDEDPFDRENHGRGLIIPDEVRAYWQTHSPTLQYDVSNFAASIDWSINDSPVKNQR